VLQFVTLDDSKKQVAMADRDFSKLTGAEFLRPSTAR
jgi:hypothetical protein